MRLLSLHRRASRGGYTLVEALVAGIVLMIGVSAASSLTLALITQDEMSQRTATALNYQENAAQLYRLGLSPTQVEALLPADPVVSDLTIATGTESVAHSPTVPGLPNVTMPYADVSVTFNPGSATQSWTGRTWTGGDKDASRTLTLRAFRSPTSRTVP